MKANCWDFMNCGKDCPDGGEDTQETCPVISERRLHGVHGGKNAGRACWVVAGTCCNGRMQGNFTRKYGNCIMCDFYKLVRTQEKDSFQLRAEILDVMLSEQVQ